jgi:protein gp37
MKNTRVEWAKHTYNPWRGCAKVSPGCKNCYMYRDAGWQGWDATSVRRTSPGTFNAPLTWLEPARVFTCSLSDFFLAEADAWRPDAWDIIRRTPWLTYIVLTKRPENIPDRLPSDWGQGWHNVWLGVSVERADYLWRVERLVRIPAQVRFISYEPALGPVDFSPYFSEIDWLISGGESEPAPRPADLDWFRAVRDQCRAAGVLYFHKQHGGRTKIDGHWGGNRLDGMVHQERPPMWWEERAAIMEYEGGLSRDDAERRAMVPGPLSDSPRAAP